jgi:hypothetical protein
MQLELDEFDRRELTFADGSKKLASYVGPLTVAVANRKGLAGAMVDRRRGPARAHSDGRHGPRGAPATRDVIPNPQSPNIQPRSPKASEADPDRLNHGPPRRNEAFLQTSFLYGGNAAYIEDLYARYQESPGSVGRRMAAFFGGLSEDGDLARKNARGASGRRRTGPCR